MPAKPHPQSVADRHVPMRRCVVCRESRPQAELLRFAQDAAGEWQLDPKRKAGGRGAWLCRDREACRQPKALRRFFRAQAGRVAQELAAFDATDDVFETKARKTTTGDGGINAR